MSGNSKESLIEITNLRERDFPGMAIKKLDRRNFGPGIAGERAFALINSVTACIQCGERAFQTIDYDVLGGLEQLPLCWDGECQSKAGERVMKDLEKINRTTVFGKNGWGRA